jgi:prophage antirepressor-like protein
MINIFKNEKYTISYIKVENTLYFRAKEVCKILEYSDTSQAVRLHVEEDDKIKFENLIKNYDDSVGPVTSTPLDYNDKQTIYINISGLFCLILGSKKPEAKLF